mmetsp:Transcript_18047/g.68119  ORF Transcript_18047/g.68119 Transcript_18047/m.68119 type:complete len:232 (+) Transcript_18047:2827-3522(+)
MNKSLVLALLSLGPGSVSQAVSHHPLVHSIASHTAVRPARKTASARPRLGRCARPASLGCVACSALERSLDHHRSGRLPSQQRKVPPYQVSSDGRLDGPGGFPRPRQLPPLPPRPQGKLDAPCCATEGSVVSSEEPHAHVSLDATGVRLHGGALVRVHQPHRCLHRAAHGPAAFGPGRDPCAVQSRCKLVVIQARDHLLEHAAPPPAREAGAGVAASAREPVSGGLRRAPT